MTHETMMKYLADSLSPGTLRLLTLPRALNCSQAVLEEILLDDYQFIKRDNGRYSPPGFDREFDFGSAWLWALMFELERDGLAIDDEMLVIPLNMLQEALVLRFTKK